MLDLGFCLSDICDWCVGLAGAKLKVAGFICAGRTGGFLPGGIGGFLPGGAKGWPGFKVDSGTAGLVPDIMLESCTNAGDICLRGVNFGSTRCGGNSTFRGLDMGTGGRGLEGGGRLDSAAGLAVDAAL